MSNIIDLPCRRNRFTPTRQAAGSHRRNHGSRDQILSQIVHAVLNRMGDLIACQHCSAILCWWPVGRCKVTDSTRHKQHFLHARHRHFHQGLWRHRATVSRNPLPNSETQRLGRARRTAIATVQRRGSQICVCDIGCQGGSSRYAESSCQPITSVLRG